MSTIKTKDKVSTDSEVFIGEWKQIGTTYPEQYELPVTYKDRNFTLLLRRRASPFFQLFIIEKYTLEEIFENNNLKIEDLEEAKKKALEMGIPRIKYIVDYPYDWKCERLKKLIEEYLDSISKDSKSILGDIRFLRNVLIEYAETFQKTEQYKRLLAEARKQAEEELKEIDRKLKEMIMHD